MKKRLFMFLAFCLFLGIVTALPFAASAEEPIRIMVGGKILETDVDPIIVEGRTLLPVRALFEAIGATVDWDNDARTVTAVKEDTTVILTIDSDQMLVNGEAQTLDVPAMIQNDRTLIPLRASAEAFGLDVDWSDEHRLVTVKIPVYVVTRHEKSNGTLDTYQYDEAGDMVYHEEQTKYQSETETYEYDDTHNIIQWNWEGVSYGHPTAGSVTYEYDAYGRRIYQTGYFGEKAVRYNEDGVIVYKKEWGTEYFYDDSGEPLFVKDSKGNIITKYEYDENGNYVYSEHIISDSEIEWTRNEYNAAGVLIHRYNSKGEEYQYADDGKLTYSVTLKRNAGAFLEYEPSWVYTTKEYDEQGRITLNKYYQERNGIHEESEEITYQYNDETHEIYQTKIRVGYASITSTTHVITRYDDQDRLVYQDSNGKWDKYQYNDAGQVLYHNESNGDWTRYIYNDAGEMIYWENQKGDWERWEYDEEDHLILNKTSSGWGYKWEYDEEGNLIYYEKSNGSWEKWEYERVVK